VTAGGDFASYCRQSAADFNDRNGCSSRVTCRFVDTQSQPDTMKTGSTSREMRHGGLLSRDGWEAPRLARFVTGQVLVGRNRIALHADLAHAVDASCGVLIPTPDGSPWLL